MSRLLYGLVGIIARFHNAIMQWNNSCENVLTDKQLHFLVIGLIGMGMLFFIYPLFQLLSENHVLVIAWIYVFTVIIVLVFAIEIGQGFTGTGTMDFDDIVAGVAGFMVMFVIFAMIRWAVRLLGKIVGFLFGK